MIRSLALAALLALCACARQASPPPAPPAPAAATAPAQPPAAQTTAGQPPAGNPAATAASPTQSETQQATASQETGAEDQSPATASDASLERMTALPASDQLPGGKWKAGVNYDVLVPAQPSSVDPGKVEVLEVFWLACPHCYALEPFITAWRKTAAPYIQFVRVPVMWGPVHQLHAHLFYTLEALGRDDLVEKAFDTIGKHENPLVGNDANDTVTIQQNWAAQNGVSADDFAKAYKSFSVNTDLQRAQVITERYHVTGVPFIAVNGKYTTGVGEAGGETQLIELINDLAASEHRHGTRAPR